MHIRNYLMALLGAGSMLGVQASNTEEITIKLLETSDVHGAYFPYDFINRRPQKGSLARISTFVDAQRKQYGDNVLLFDNGDILQGQPVAYYYNYIDTASTHVCAAMLNYLKYDAGNMGEPRHRNRTCHIRPLGEAMPLSDAGRQHHRPAHGRALLPSIPRVRTQRRAHRRAGAYHTRHPLVAARNDVERTALRGYGNMRAPMGRHYRRQRASRCTGRAVSCRTGREPAG